MRCIIRFLDLPVFYSANKKLNFIIQNIKSIDYLGRRVDVQRLFIKDEVL